MNKKVGKLVSSILVLVSLTVTCAVPEAFASSDTYETKNVRYGGGGMVTGSIVASDGTRYVRTDVGGAYRLDVGSDEWVPLNESNAAYDTLNRDMHGSYFGVAGIAVHPTNPNIVYLAVGLYYYRTGAIMKSTDRGETWQITKLGNSDLRFEGNGNDGRNYGECIQVDTDGTVYIGTPFHGMYIWDGEIGSTPTHIPFSSFDSDFTYQQPWNSSRKDFWGIRTVMLDGDYVYMGLDLPEDDASYAGNDGIWRMKKNGTGLVKTSGVTALPRSMTKANGVLYAVAAPTRDGNDSVATRLWKSTDGSTWEQVSISYSADGSKDLKLNNWLLQEYASFEKKYVETRDEIKSICTVTHNGTEYLVMGTNGYDYESGNAGKKMAKIFTYDGTNWEGAVITRTSDEPQTFDYAEMESWRGSDPDPGIGLKDVMAYSNPTTSKLEISFTTGWGVFTTKDFFANRYYEQKTVLGIPYGSKTYYYRPFFKADVKGIEEGCICRLVSVPNTDKFYVGAMDGLNAMYTNPDSYDYNRLSRPTGGSCPLHDLGVGVGFDYSKTNSDIMVLHGGANFYYEVDRTKATDTTNVGPIYGIKSSVQGRGQNVFRSKDGGETWEPMMTEQVKLGLVGGPVAISKNGDHIVAIPINVSKYKKNVDGTYVTDDEGNYVLDNVYPMYLVSDTPTGTYTYSGDGVATYNFYEWAEVGGLPANMITSQYDLGRDYLEADKDFNDIFYALVQTVSGKTRTYSIYTSYDGGATFIHSASMPVADSLGGDRNILTQDQISGDLYFHSNDGVFRYNRETSEFTKIEGFSYVKSYSLGVNEKSAKAQVLYVLGKYNDKYGLWRSTDDTHTSFTNIVDLTTWGLGNAGVIEADKSIYGRVYIGTGGRGVLYTVGDDWKYDLKMNGEPTDTISAGNLTFTARYNGDTLSGNATLFVAYYDKNGRYKGMAKSDTITLSDSTRSCTANITLPTLSEGDYVKCFVWDSEKGMRKLFEELVYQQ